MRGIKMYGKPVDVTVRTYDGSKYMPDSDITVDVKYLDVICSMIVSGEDAKMIAAERDADARDEFNEYLELRFTNGYVSTFRNSHTSIIEISLVEARNS